jgi:hypothetical protein
MPYQDGPRGRQRLLCVSQIRMECWSTGVLVKEGSGRQNREEWNIEAFIKSPPQSLRGAKAPRQSGAAHCPERSEGSHPIAERSFDPPLASSGRLAVQVGLPLGRETCRRAQVESLKAERLRFARNDKRAPFGLITVKTRPLTLASPPNK